jgi:hypothetical protein
MNIAAGGLRLTAMVAAACAAACSARALTISSCSPLLPCKSHPLLFKAPEHLLYLQGVHTFMPQNTLTRSRDAINGKEAQR